MKIFVISNLGGHSDGVANAVLNNDEAGVANSHQALAAAHDQMEAFAQHWGAADFHHSGEDGCFAVEVDNPETFINDLQSLKEHIQELSGYDLTVGAGTALAEAGKAFLHAKLNDNSEVSIYHPDMDAELSSMGDGAEEMPAEQEPFYEQESEEKPQLEALKDFHSRKDSEQGNSDVQNDPSDENEVGEPEGNTQGNILPEESVDGDFSNEEHENKDSEVPISEIDYKSDEGLDEEYNPAFDGAVSNTTNVAISGNEDNADYDGIGRVPYHPSAELNAGAPKEIVVEGEEDADPDHMVEESDSFNHQAQVDGEPENEEEPLEESEEELIDIPDSKEQKEMLRQEEEDTDANAEPGINPDDTLNEAEDEFEDNQLMNPDEEIDPAMEQGSQEEGIPNDVMPEEEQVMGDNVDPNGGDDAEYEMAGEMAEEEQVAEDLRNQIGAALDGFRSQKDALMAMKDQAPELYESTIVLLKTLIQMSDLIFGDEGQEQEPMYGQEEVPSEEVVEEVPAEEEAPFPQS